MHPQVRFPADSKGDPQAIHRRILITIGERLASLRATFFCSMSLTTLGGSVFNFGADSPTPRAPRAPNPVRMGALSLEVSSCEERFVTLDFNIMFLPLGCVYLQNGALLVFQCSAKFEPTSVIFGVTPTNRLYCAKLGRRRCPNAFD